MFGKIVLIIIIIVSIILAAKIGRFINSILYGNRLFVNTTKIWAIYFFTFIIVFMVLFGVIGGALGYVKFDNKGSRSVEEYSSEATEADETIDEIENTSQDDTEAERLSDEYSGEYGEVSYIEDEEQLFPESGLRYLTQEDVEGLDNDYIRYGLNEIYARHGRMFNNQEIQDYFNSLSWYTPVYSPEEFSELENSIFNEYEKENIRFLSDLIS
nr:YARHG domain-containing protein [uncultured Lachnoanaerobaculum sp.]